MGSSANRRSGFSLFRLALASLILILCGAADLIHAETWTDASGKRRIEADFVGLQAGEVHLKRKADGVTIKVPLKQLSAQSQQLAQSLQSRTTAAPAAPTEQPAGSAGASSLPATTATDHPTLRQVADFVDASTVAVGHLDLTRLNLEAAMRLYRDCVPGTPGETSLTEWVKAAAEVQRQVIQAGLSDVYLVVRVDLTSPQLGSFLLLAPVSAGKDPQAVLKILSPVLPVVPTLKGNRVLLTPPVHLEAWQRIQPQARQDFVAPLRAAGNTAVQLAVVPTADLRRIPLGVEVSKKPNPAEALVLSLVTAQQKGRWAVLTVNAPPTPALALILQMDDAAAASTFQGHVNQTLDLMRQDQKFRQALPQLDELVKRLAPTLRDRQARFLLTAENGGVKTVLAAVGAAVRAEAEFQQGQANVNNLKELGLALHNFHDTFKTFPPQASPSRDGKPLLSWRVAILPFLGATSLYNQFHRDEPWDSEHNRRLIPQMPATFRSPGLPAEVRDELHAKGMTMYLAPVGQGTIFGGTEATSIANITDGTSNTIMLVEAAPAKAVIWTKPEDLTIDAKDPRTGLTGQPGGFRVLMADGSVHRLLDSIDPQMLRRLFQRNDGQPVSIP